MVFAGLSQRACLAVAGSDCGMEGTVPNHIIGTDVFRKNGRDFSYLLFTIEIKKVIKNHIVKRKYQDDTNEKSKIEIAFAVKNRIVGIIETQRHQRHGYG